MKYRTARCIAVLSFCLPVTQVCVANNQDRGAQILEKQLQQARHLKELEYQAEVLERQARIAKAQQQIDKTVGLESVMNAQPQPRAQITLKRKRQVSLPKIEEMTDTQVTFLFANQETGVYSVGEVLPSGLKVVSISMVDGVALSQGNTQYRIHFSW